MRLMDKKAVNASLATERKAQIEQGAKIAEKVDAVRESLAQEQKRLEDFRRESVTSTQSEIDSKVRERDSLLSEIQVRKEELAELRKPLDSAWEDVKRSEREIDALKIILLQKQSEIEQGIALNIQRERANSAEEQRISEEQGRTTASLSKAEALKADAAKELLEARSESLVITTRAEEREEAVASREVELTVRGQEIVKKISEVEGWRSDLQRREKKLKSNQEVLIKSQEYLKRKKL